MTLESNQPHQRVGPSAPARPSATTPVRESPSPAERLRLQTPQSASIAPPAPSVPERPTRRDRRSLLVGLGFLAGLAVATVAWAFARPETESMTSSDVDAAVEQALLERDGNTGTAAQAYNQIAPSLVVVRAFPVGSDPSEEGAAGTAIGGGVVINEKGQILTSHHVVADAGTIEVVFADGTTSTATIVTGEPTRDIAVLEADRSAGAIVPAVLANSRTAEIGDPIFAVGNPLGLTGSLSAGVISGLDRDIPADGDVLLSDLIQFDAAVNQGSSGGPLLDQRGHVIGIVTALADPSSTGYFIGIGFAVPIDLAVEVSAEGPSQ